MRLPCTPDGVRYLTMGGGQRVPLPYHLRWFVPFVARQIGWRWRAVHIASLVTLAAAFAVYLVQLGHEWTAAAAGVALAALLPGVGRFARRFPILVDAPAQALALLAVVTLHEGWWWAAVPLAVAAGATKEAAPIHAAVWAWHPLLLVGMLAPAVRALVPAGPEVEGAGIKIAAKRPTWDLAGPWSDPFLVAFPWGPCLAAMWAPSWQLAAALAVGYVQLAVISSTGMPVWTSLIDTARVYQWAFPVVIAAALTVIPTAWLVPAVAVAFFNPWGWQR